MPTYEYECKTCGRKYEEVRRIIDRKEEGLCVCGGRTKQAITRPGGLCFGTFREGFSPAFGKHFRSKGELKEELARIKGETGKELVEVGNEKVETRKQKKSVDWDQFGKDLKKAWRKNG